YQIICDKKWLQTLEKKKKIDAFPVHPTLDRRAHPDGDLEHPWCRVLVQLYKKQPYSKVFPLKCPLEDSRVGDDFGQKSPLSYSMAVYEVMCENFRNLWSDFYKKCPGAHVKGEKDGKAKSTSASSINLLPYDAVLKEVIYRVFKCPIIHCGLDRLREDSGDVKSEELALECHGNIMPALICIETSQYLAVLFYPPGLSTTLYDCITFSPAILHKNYNKPLFIVYQLLQLFRSLHQQGLVVGELSLQDILLNENLWALVIPPVDANITAYFLEEVMTHSPSEATGLQELDLPIDGVGGGGVDTMDVSNLKLDLKFSYDLKQFTLRDYCDMWCNGQISNFDYLTILNTASGRSQNNPSYHHIMPWVTNFESRNGLQWRDLTKSKYRLNKGDIHLDLMFQHATQQAHRDLEANCSTSPQQVAHHVSDFLSEITYFVYMARRTPQHILREHVRPIWVPAEYPASIQRLQEWTPDECIPEFYTDPMIFKSIHEDLPDLEIPSWASCPEDFVAKHREALESQYVSERLHHWIDLNFGYKLSGKAAIKSKNVCLPMVDQHKTLCKRGIVQLFTHPHPAKRTISPWFVKQAPRIQNLLAGQPKVSGKHKSSRKLNKSLDNLSKSTESLDGQGDNSSHNPKVSPRLTLKLPEDNISTSSTSSSSNFYKTTNFIELPKDYNPILLLQSLESSQQFVSKTFPLQKPTENAPEKMLTSDLLFEDYTENHSFTNHLFNEGDSPLDNNPSISKGKSKNFLASSKQPNKTMPLHVHHMKKIKDLQILGCLIVELFAMPRIRPLIGHNLQPKFETRLKACLTIMKLHKQDIPKCLRYITNILLNLSCQDVVTEKGMPLPSAGQLLEPIYHNLLIPFPTNFYASYALIRSLYSFDFAFILLELHTHFQCNGHECSRYTEIDRLRVQFERKIGKCKVMACCAHIRRLLEPVGFEQFPPIDILLPHMINLLTDEHTSILTAWNLFDSVAQALGIQNTQKYLLQPIMKLYDVESFERGMISVRNRSITDSLSNSSSHLRFSTSSSFKSRKSVKLYHQIFLLRLIVRFGLKCFLQNFIAPLIEAVGGYKEPEDGNGLHYHSSAAGARRSSRNLSLVNNPTVVVNEDDMTLMSPQKPGEDLEDNTLSQEGSNIKPEIEDVFSFDDDANSDHISTSDHISNKSLDSFDMSQRPTTAEEAKELEDDDRQLETTPEKLAISEIIYGSKISNNSFEDADKISLNSQTANDSPLHNSASQLGPRSPTIAIPASVFRRSYQLNTIDCDIGSRKSVDSFEILQNAAEEEQKQIRAKLRTEIEEEKNTKQQNEGGEATKSKEPIEEELPSSFSQEANDSLQASVISKMSEEKSLQNNCISEMSSISLIWLSHRLGPVLTSRYIAKNLLKMLTLCYVGQENLLPESGRGNEDLQNLNYFTVSDARVVGDRSAVRVLECLMAIASLYGEQVILMQYFPHISELIALGVKRITSSLEGAIISTLQLMKYLIPCLTDATIMEHLKDILLDSIILPVLRFLGSAQVLMPSGYLGRSVLARKFLDAVYVLSVRLGSDMTREHLCFTVLRPFFLIFDKAFGETINFENNDNRTAQISPPNPERQHEAKRELEEIGDVFSPALAHSAYLAFLRFLGEDIMRKTLLNLEFVLTLCHEFEQPDYKPFTINSRKSSDAVDCPVGPTTLEAGSAAADSQAANSFGTQVVGNRIEVVSPTTQQTPKIISKEKIQPIDTMEVLDMVAYKFEHLPNTRYLKGNWLAYWRHEITRSEKDTTLSLQQIKLQSFVGHTNSVRAILALDNENSFISASKDKTVKLWSLRSEGDGFKTKSCQFTYTDHRKSIHSLAFLESLRFVVSCDSGVHIWDPFIGRPLGVLDSPKHNPITIVKCLPSPSPLVLAGTAEASVKIIDARCMQYVNEWRVSTNTQNNATVRCLTVAPSGNWMAVGLSSGYIVMLDTRTGMILNSWRRMECDILQLAAPNDQQLISSALDHSLAVWHAHDGNLHYQLVPPAEPAHFLQTNGPELVYATTGNRIGIYSDLSSSHASHTVTKLRSETFKGVLTSLAVLPLNRAFLAGNESGNISLLC
ncbi:WD repeat-containing protein 81-like, partial [Musca vetustissima]|uniref:WD repeat-containing protein 81-like n=1 Tax=Musca vetustissima TaxID=27455 RepID=UPI002AB65C90